MIGNFFCFHFRTQLDSYPDTYDSMCNLNKLVLNVDYSIAPLYITNDIIIVGIYLINYTSKINSIHLIPSIPSISSISSIPSISSTQYNIQTFNFLSGVDPNTITNQKKNHKYKNLNKYNCIYSILNRHISADYFKKQYLILETYLNTIPDIKNKNNINNNKTICKLSIPLKHILQNSMNYLPKLEIIFTKKSFQNLLNP